MYEPAFYLPYVSPRFSRWLHYASEPFVPLSGAPAAARSIRGTDTPGCRHDNLRLLRLLAPR